MFRLCHSVQRYYGWHAKPTTIPGLARFIVIYLRSPAGASADTDAGRAGSGSCIVCEWVMPARVDAVSGGSALRCLCAGRILATSPSLGPPIARGLKYRRGQPTHKRFRARVVVRFGGSTPRCLSARRALGPMTGGTRNAYSETSNVSTLSTRIPPICLNDDGPTRRCPTVRGYPPTHAGGVMTHMTLRDGRSRVRVRACARIRVGL